MWRVDSLEKTLMLGGIGGRRRRGRQRMRWLDGRKELEWTPGVGDGQGGLACCDSWGHKESDMTDQLNWTDWNQLSDFFLFLFWCRNPGNSRIVAFETILRDGGICGWDLWGGICVFLQLIHDAVQRKPTQHGTATTIQLKTLRWMNSRTRKNGFVSTHKCIDRNFSFLLVLFSPCVFKIFDLYSLWTFWWDKKSSYFSLNSYQAISPPSTPNLSF